MSQPSINEIIYLKFHPNLEVANEVKFLNHPGLFAADNNILHIHTSTLDPTQFRFITNDWPVPIPMHANEYYQLTLLKSKRQYKKAVVPVAICALVMCDNAWKAAHIQIWVNQMGRLCKNMQKLWSFVGKEVAWI